MHSTPDDRALEKISALSTEDNAPLSRLMSARRELDAKREAVEKIESQHRLALASGFEKLIKGSDDFRKALRSATKEQLDELKSAERTAISDLLLVYTPRRR